MIYSISSDKPSFKTVRFKSGLNVVLATRMRESNKKDSRNGLGKSALIDILHFCLGGDRSGVLTNSVLDGWTFTVKLDIGDRVYSISRIVAKYAKILVIGDYSNWSVLSKTADKEQLFSVGQWRDALGSLMYGIDPDHNMEYSPTFRSLVSYFARREGQGGYHDPFRQNARQRTWDIQVNSAYLLGLDWKLASQKQVLRDRENALKLIKQKTAAATIRDTLGSEANLEAVRIRLADEINAEASRIVNFKVHETYRSLEADADRMTKEVHEMLNQNVGDRRILEFYKSSMVEEEDADPKQIADIYEEAGLLFPDMVVKRLEDVQRFHKNIVQNRKNFLSSEIDELNVVVLKRDREIMEIDDKKSKTMGILKTHGALDEFLRMQENHQGKVAELEDVINRLKILKDVNNEKDALMLESATLLHRLKLDLAERKNLWAEAVRAFNLYSNSLYNKSGTLSIGSSTSGYTFKVSIERSGSHGYENMKIFCYDLVLARLWAHKQASPRFLIHDSTMFADVDERQTAHALQLASIESQKHGYQYICMMNSDSVPRNDLGPDFDFDSRVVIKFTDATNDGGLLGIRF